MSIFFGVRENASSWGVHPEKKIITRMNLATMARLKSNVLKKKIEVL
jgi:hypothetical protein